MPTPRVLAPVPPAVRALIDALAAAGHEAYLVGGCVRDLLVGRPVNDFDLATSAAPDALLALFPTAVPIGIRYGTVMVPTEIGPYEITREIGRGGMGVVYLARDTTLDRDVAIKCLPDELAQDEDRLRRFEREAKLLASLNHPNIASIYGLEEVDGKRYLILEYVEGDTLEKRLLRGALPVDEALPIAKQIAEAIEAANEKGVIHRDLKPANIKFDVDENVKILDFGLAKALAEPASEAVMENSPTLSVAETHGGIILGTAAYMGPEQARGS